MTNNLANFKIVNNLGEGNFGKVYLIQQEQANKKFAVKITNSELQSPEQKSFCQHLLEYSKIKHQAILPLYGFSMVNFEQKNFPMIFTEFIQKGSLDLMINQNDTLSPSNKYIILLGVAEGINFLNSQGITHGKLKPSNILLDQNSYPLICDYEELQISNITNYSIKDITYIAPEIISKKSHTKTSDSYSFSLIMYQLITGKNPYPNYENASELQIAISEDKRPDLSLVPDESIRQILAVCWSNNPEDRPPFSVILDCIKQERFKRVMNIKSDDEEVDKYKKYLNNNSLPSLYSGNTKISEKKVHQVYHQN